MRRSSARRAPWVVLAIVPLAVAAGAPGAAALPPEFPINTHTTGYQFTNGATRLAGGDFVVAWHGSGPGDDAGSFARRITAAGVPVGPEFRVNTYTSARQAYPSIAADPDGGFVVVWTSYGEDGDRGGVFGQRYDSLGNPSGSAFQVNTLTQGRQFNPRVAVGAAGQFVVTWTSYGGDGSQYGVMARRYDATGAPVGGEFQVNTFTDYLQVDSSVGIDFAGRFVVAWTSYQDGHQRGVFGQRFDASGAKAGPEFQINTYTTGFQGGAALAVNADGNFVVVWSSYGQDGSYSGVFGQRFDAAGTAQGGEFRLNTYTTQKQTGSDVAWDGQGNFVVTWWSDYQDGSSYAVIARRYQEDGTQLGPEFRVNTYTTGQQTMPVVATEPDGGFLVAWVDSYQQAIEPNVYARIVPDLIFADPFESGGLGAWSSASTDGGDLSVTGAAALAGSFGLQGVVDDTAGLYVQDDSPDDEGRYRVRFSIDPNGFDPGEAAGKRRTRVLLAFQDAPMRRLFAVVLRRLGGQYAIGARARRDDNTQASTPFFNVGDAPLFVDVAWTQASTTDANDGRLDLWIDGAHVSTLPGLDNHASGIDFVRLGALSVKATATGTLFWDGFESRRVSGIN